MAVVAVAEGEAFVAEEGIVEAEAATLNVCSFCIYLFIY